MPDLAALRARYQPEPAPTCRTCGGPMAAEERLPDGTIRWRCPRDQRKAYTEAGAPDVLAVLDRLAAAQAALTQIVARFDRWYAAGDGADAAVAALDDIAAIARAALGEDRLL